MYMQQTPSTIINERNKKLTKRKKFEKKSYTLNSIAYIYLPYYLPINIYNL